MRDVLAETILEKEQRTLKVAERPAAPCPVCGRIFEPPLLDAATGAVRIPGHVQGDPRTCETKGGSLAGSKRDRRNRRGDASRGT